ncbi:MAG: LysM peptidoglycan-binding domain-containing protein [Cyclobacteriaceae bacterium]
MRFSFSVILFAISIIGMAAPAKVVMPADSVGTLVRRGEVYIVHKVDAGETLFAISRQYDAHVDILRKSNPDINTDKLGVGDTLLVPVHVQLSQGDKTIHTVKAGETLFQLSRQYKVSVDEIKNWNTIGQTPLSIGQEIVIYHIPSARAPEAQASVDTKKYVVHTVKEGETLFAISRAYGVTVGTLKKLNNLPDERISFGQQLMIRERELISSSELQVATISAPNMVITGASESTNRMEDSEEEEEEEVYDKRLSRAEALEQEKQRIRAIRAAEKKALSEYEKKSEIGFASAIEGGPETKKFLALHRSAPVGTIMQIRNEMNDLAVFVRVVGKLPDTGVNDKVNIRISQAAYEKLGGINERFPVEITYIE